MYLCRNNDWVGRGDEGIFLNRFTDVSQRDFGGQRFPMRDNWLFITVVYIDYGGFSLANSSLTEDNVTHSQHSDSSAEVLEYTLQSWIHPQVDAQPNTYYESSRYNTPKSDESCLGIFFHDSQ